MEQLIALFLSLVIFSNAGCGWHPRNTAIVPSYMKKIVFNSTDSNTHLSRAICKQLHTNNIKLIKKDSLHRNIPSFNILNSSLKKNVVSIFQDGYTVEYQMVLSVDAAISIPGKDIYPINTKVYRSFFNERQIALVKDTEQQIIINEMYDKAAEQLIYKLLSSMYLMSKDINIKAFVPLIMPDISLTQ